MSTEEKGIAAYVTPVVSPGDAKPRTLRTPSRPQSNGALQVPQGGGFVRGPIPLEWLQCAIPQGRKALHVAMAIWYSAGFKKEVTIKLTRKKLKVFGVTTETARTLLHKFEEVGLVSVDRKRGRSPIVTIKSTANLEEEPCNGETTKS